MLSQPVQMCHCCKDKVSSMIAQHAECGYLTVALEVPAVPRVPFLADCSRWRPLQSEWRFSSRTW